MNINWMVRIKNKTFWISIIPALLLLVQVAVSVFGVNVDLGDIGNKLLALVNAVFGVLVIMGIVADPTTEGLSDSKNALEYKTPKKTEEEEEK